jgi:hypothetical protein
MVIDSGETGTTVRITAALGLPEQIRGQHAE